MRSCQNHSRLIVHFAVENSTTMSMSEQLHSAQKAAPLGRLALGAAGARELNEAELTKRNYTPGKDAWFVC